MFKGSCHKVPTTISAMFNVDSDFKHVYAHWVTFIVDLTHESQTLVFIEKYIISIKFQIPPVITTGSIN